MDKILIVGAGGFLGAVTRYLLCGAVQRLHGGTLPLGTLTVNVLGCFIIGVAMAIVEDGSFLGPNGRLLLMIGPRLQVSRGPSQHGVRPRPDSARCSSLPVGGMRCIQTSSE